MKQNFSDFDVKKVSTLFNGNVFNVHLNKAGNIQLDVKDLSKFNMCDWWSNRSYVFYNTPAGFIIRCKSWRGSTLGASIFPLNMNYKSRNVEFTYEWAGKTYTSHGYSIKYSTFKNLDDAIVYFIEYLNLYHNIIDF